MQRLHVFFIAKGRWKITKKDKALYTFLTVLVTVHAYVFYSLYIVNGNMLLNVTGKDTVIGAINSIGEVYIVGRYLPIWSVVLIEILFRIHFRITI